MSLRTEGRSAPGPRVCYHRGVTRRERATTLAELRPRSAGAGRALSELAALLERDHGARALARAGDAIELAIDDGAGRNVLIALRPAGATLAGVLEGTRCRDEEHGGWYEDEGVNDELLALAGRVAEALEEATGWEIRSDHLPERVPDGTCDLCGATLYVDDEVCRACRAPCDEDERAAPIHARRAAALVAALLAEGLLELADPRAGAWLARRVARRLANGGEACTPAALLEMLVHADAVAEVYADESQVAALLARTREGASTGPRGRGFGRRG